MSILDYFPSHLKPRQQQIDILEQVEKSWDTSNVIVIKGPVAIGKTAVEATIAKWSKDTTNILVPTNILLDQFVKDYKDFPALFKKAYYPTEAEYHKQKAIVAKSDFRVMNYHVYKANKLWAPIMICDEAHKLLDILDGMYSVKLWHNKYPFPGNIKEVAEVVEWIQTYQESHDDPALSKALKQILNIQDSATVSYEHSYLRGRPQKVMHITPSTTKFNPPYLWPHKHVKKIVLMSATTGPKDVNELGLAGRRVHYIEVDSPIPAANRRVFFKPNYNMSYAYVDKATTILAKNIEELLLKHSGQKGLIHVPYSVSKRLKELVTDNRLMFHDRHNKAEILERFKRSTDDVVLVASGLYEGVDLPYDLARWQVIGKIPFLSLGDPRVKKHASIDSTWYAWEAIKKVLQAAGRIVRAPDDEGMTYIFDSNFKRLWNEDQKLPEHLRMFPSYFLDSLVFA